MKKTIGFSWAIAPMLVVLCAGLFSFSLPGGHSVRIYLDSKLVLDQAVRFGKDAPAFTMDPSENHSQLIVKYNECGRTVTGRKITVRDNAGNTLKEFRFEGSSTGFDGSMSCSLKDIVALKAKSGKSLKLFYASAEFPEGQWFATMQIGNDAKAMN